MPSIQLLDQNTINKIAAGEVVERPLSIVKELVENAIDAGAMAITVEITEGGLSLIRITDNGIGIDPLDIRNAFLRHSTSKIKQIEDLYHVKSLGFRGEALASIAAIAQVELITKTKDKITGIRYLIEGGAEKKLEEIGSPDGTTMIVRNVFFNTPVRKKFLKSPMVEASYIADLMNKLALGNPEISFKFINNHQVKLHTIGNGSVMDCIFEIFGKDIAKNLLEIDESNEEFTISGFIGKPVIGRANRNYENYYINGRYIKSKVLQKAIEDAYKTKLTIHQYPFVVLYIRVLSQSIDVNVHPNKMDIRFNNEDQIYDSVFTAITNGLSRKELIPEVSFEVEKKKSLDPPIRFIPEPFEVKRISLETKPVERIEEIREESVKEPYIGDQMDYKEEFFIEPELKKEHKIVGQLFKTYWIVEFSDKYYIIDQHAAHEKVLYEQILHQLKEKHVDSQLLLEPLMIPLSMKEKVRYQNQNHLFAELGFQIDDFGGDEILIRAVPFIFNKPIQPSDFIMLLDVLEEEYREEKFNFLLDEVATMACKAAVKGNSEMSLAEYEALIDQLFLLENPFTCPHGRPTMISMTKYELEKKFKRIQ